MLNPPTLASSRQFPSVSSSTTQTPNQRTEPAIDDGVRSTTTKDRNMPRVSSGAALSCIGEGWGASEQGDAPELQYVKPVRRLPSNVKRFIVIQNACGCSPKEVSSAVKTVFDLEVSLQAVERYDPTKTAGQSLSLPLKMLFREMQREFEAMVMKAGVADQKWRIAKLHLIAQQSFDRGNYKLSMDAMEQAARDLGGVYANKASLAVDDKRLLLAKLLRCAPEDLPVMKAAAQEAKENAHRIRE